MDLDSIRQISRTISYENILYEVKGHLSAEYANTLVNTIDSDSATDMVKQLITKYINDNGIGAEGIEDTGKLIDRLYNDLSKFGIITEYISKNEVEEINCNSFEDIEVITNEGYSKLPEGYVSPAKLQDYAKKIMIIGGVTVDESNPIGDGYIDTGVRASAILSPCVDDDIGAVLSIRRQRMAGITREEYLKNDTATDEELDLIQTLVNYGVSIVFGGSVGSGKTTDMNYFLRQVSNDKRIFTIEDTRELDLIKRDSSGKVTNRVIHTKTRFSDNPEKNIDMNDLLRMSLRFSPHYIICSEMRGAEALPAQEAARTGHIVLTSLHSNSARAAYKRILTMCNMSGTKISDRLLLDMIIEAFPIVVYKKQLPDRSRKVMEIFEATGQQDGNVIGQTLYQYIITDNVYTDDLPEIKGYHKKIGNISSGLAHQLLDGGAPLSVVKRFAGNDFEPERR